MIDNSRRIRLQLRESNQINYVENFDVPSEILKVGSSMRNEMMGFYRERSHRFLREKRDKMGEL